MGLAGRPTGEHHGTKTFLLGGTFQTATVSQVGTLIYGDFTSVVTNAGASVTRSHAYACLAIDPSYAPASDFRDIGVYNMWFTVTGNAVAGVPEPSTMALCLGGLLMLVGGDCAVVSFNPRLLRTLGPARYAGHGDSPSPDEFNRVPDRPRG